MTRYLPAFAIFLLLSGVSACKTGSDPGVAGIYQSWDDVVTRWIGKHKEDLYLELGPPNLHPKEEAQGVIEDAKKAAQAAEVASAQVRSSANLHSEAS